jgi:hypothetical protein
MCEFLCDSRLDIPALLNHRGLTGEGVEVGAGTGWYSNRILLGSRLSRLYSVDPWTGDGRTRCLSEPQNYLQTVQNLSRHGLRSVVLRMLSVEAAELFRDGSLDFVYIDANHGLKWIREDIAAWAPKVRPRGVLAGHDYCATRFDVKQAVDEFAQASGRKLYLTRLDQVSNGHEIRSWVFLISKFLN